MNDFFNVKGCGLCGCMNKPGLLKGLGDDDMDVLFKNRHEVIFHPDETIFKQNTALTHIACVKEGFVKMSTEANHNRNFMIRIVQPGEFIGGMGIYVEEIHLVTCTAITAVRVCLINLQSFKNTLEQSNKLAINLITKLNRHAIQSTKQTVNLTSKSMYSRVAMMLIYLSEVVYKDTNFDTTLKRQDLADLCALAKESTIRILKEFRDNRVITINNNSFIIHNMQELKKISRFS